LTVDQTLNQSLSLIYPDLPEDSDGEAFSDVVTLIGAEQADWSKGSIDGACFGADGARFRFNVFRRQGLMAVAMRRLEERFRPLAELGLPEARVRAAERRRR